MLRSGRSPWTPAKGDTLPEDSGRWWSAESWGRGRCCRPCRNAGKAEAREPLLMCCSGSGGGSRSSGTGTMGEVMGGGKKGKQWKSTSSRPPGQDFQSQDPGTKPCFCFNPLLRLWNSSAWPFSPSSAYQCQHCSAGASTPRLPLGGRSFSRPLPLHLLLMHGMLSSQGYEAE